MMELMNRKKRIEKNICRDGVGNDAYTKKTRPLSELIFSAVFFLSFILVYNIFSARDSSNHPFKWELEESSDRGEGSSRFMCKLACSRVQQASAKLMLNLFFSLTACVNNSNSWSI
jgi:hypothetical protein